MTLQENSTLSLACSIERYPTPSISLFNPDSTQIPTIISNFKFENSLNYEFPIINQSNNGTYSCRFNTEDGNLIEKLIHVFVFCMFSFLQLFIFNFMILF